MGTNHYKRDAIECEGCDGTGTILVSDDNYEACKACGALGYIECSECLCGVAADVVCDSGLKLCIACLNSPDDAYPNHTLMPVSATFAGRGWLCARMRRTTLNPADYADGHLTRTDIPAFDDATETAPSWEVSKNAENDARLTMVDMPAVEE